MPNSTTNYSQNNNHNEQAHLPQPIPALRDKSKYQDDIAWLEPEFEEIRKLERWQRLIVLSKLADEHKIPKTFLKKAFEDWVLQRSREAERAAKLREGGKQ